MLSTISSNGDATHVNARDLLGISRFSLIPICPSRVFLLLFTGRQQTRANQRLFEKLVSVNNQLLIGSHLFEIFVSNGLRISLTYWWLWSYYKLPTRCRDWRVMLYGTQIQSRSRSGTSLGFQRYKWTTKNCKNIINFTIN